MGSGSECQYTHPFTCLLILGANRSMSSFPNLLTILWNSSAWSFHSVASCSILDSWPASILLLADMCAARTHNLFSVQNFHILQAMLLQVSLFYTTHITNVSNGCYIITHSSDRQKDFVFTVSINTYHYCFDFQNIKWSSSVLCQRPLDGVIPLVIPQPVRLATVCMVMSGIGMLLTWLHELSM